MPKTSVPRDGNVVGFWAFGGVRVSGLCVRVSEFGVQGFGALEFRI